MSYYEPEPRLEPPEPKIAFHCHGCEGEIYLGEDYYELDGELYCTRCIEDAHKYEAGID